MTRKSLQPCRRRVQYYETDRMGVAHHANYIHWMEEARIDFMEQLGFPYAEMEEQGILSPVREISCSYLRPCTFGDEISIRVSAERFDGVVLSIAYEMYGCDGQILCRARSQHVFLDKAGHFVRLKRTMPAFYEALEDLTLPEMENHDARIRYFELALERNLEQLGEAELPEGYSFARYKDGDENAWIAIEQSAKEFDSEEAGREAWQRYYAGHEDELRQRMFFVVNPQGEKVATATAYYDIRRPDDGVNGMLHWVAVRRGEQGRGLSKPIILRALWEMKAMGYTRAAIPTQTTTWLACKVYLDLGFTPVARNAERCRDGWRIIRRLTDHPALKDFERADNRLVLAEEKG